MSTGTTTNIIFLEPHGITDLELVYISRFKSDNETITNKVNRDSGYTAEFVSNTVINVQVDTSTCTIQGGSECFIVKTFINPYYNWIYKITI